MTTVFFNNPVNLKLIKPQNPVFNTKITHFWTIFLSCVVYWFRCKSWHFCSKLLNLRKSPWGHMQGDCALQVETCPSILFPKQILKVHVHLHLVLVLLGLWSALCLIAAGDCLYLIPPCLFLRPHVVNVKHEPDDFMKLMSRSCLAQVMT